MTINDRLIAHRKICRSTANLPSKQDMPKVVPKVFDDISPCPFNKPIQVIKNNLLQ